MKIGSSNRIELINNRGVELLRKYLNKESRAFQVRRLLNVLIKDCGAEYEYGLVTVCHVIAYSTDT